MKINLNQQEINALNMLRDFYEAYSEGCKTIETLFDKDTLRKLEIIDFIFKTGEGYFISTLGREYLDEIDG